MTTLTQPAAVKSAPPRRTIGFVTACSIVIANIIGTGIFTSLGFQLKDIQSGFALLMLWVIGGIAALCGALCYGELAAAMPRSGGEYHFLSKIYHPALGFMAGFVSATVGFAAPVALAAMAFGQYFNGVFGAGSPVVLSFVVVWIVTIFHVGNLRVGSAFQNVSTLVKLLLIGALIGAGFFVPSKQPISFLPAPGDKAAILSGAFAVALVYVMYSYSGWNASAYISSEIKRPEKNVPRSLLAGTSLVIVIYVLLNAIFLAATPAEELKGQLDVALIAGKHIFGENGGRFAGAIICLGLVAAISSMTWIGPRVTMSMGEDHWLLRWLGGKNKHGIPHKCHFPATALRESTSADSKLPGRGPLHAIQFAALLVACCAGRDRASFHASRNYATIPGLALPHSSCCFFDNHDLDDVLSIALAHCGIAGRFGNGAVGSAALFLRAKTP